MHGQRGHECEKCAADCAASDSPSSAGSLLEVIERPLLISGQLRQRAAGGNLVIMIDSEQPHSEKLLTLWHEVVHLLRMAGGYSQDEEEVEEWAKRLSTVCPDALAWVGIHEANASVMAHAD
jgi:hypothetical protein